MGELKGRVYLFTNISVNKKACGLLLSCNRGTNRVILIE